MNHDLGAALPRGRIVLAARELPGGPRGERRYFGNLQGRDWSVNVQLSVGRTIESVPILLGTIRVLSLVGSLSREQYARMRQHIEGIARGDASVAGNAAWNTFNKIIEHPGTSAILSALSAIPGAGQFTSTAYLAAKAVGAIGNDLTTARQKRKKSGYTAQGVAQAANQALSTAGKAVRISPQDIERAVRAYFAMQNPKKGRARINFLVRQPLSQTSEDYRELLALQFADSEGPSIELTADSLDPMPAAGEVAGVEGAPCRCHVWSDTAGGLAGFDDDFIAGSSDRASDLVDIPEVPEGATAGPMDAHDLAGPEEDDGDLAFSSAVSGAPENDVSGLDLPADALNVGANAFLDAPDASILDAPDGVAGAFGDGLEEAPGEDLGALAGPLDDEVAGAFGDGLEEAPGEDLGALAGPLDDDVAGAFGHGSEEEPTGDLGALAGPLDDDVAGPLDDDVAGPLDDDVAGPLDDDVAGPLDDDVA
ncbi:MAG: hypothetical protein L6Q76_06860, partial [Polyangiaceae bacterium]|nr:hypothetical protein [Polyangiaceae bacterium]